MYSIGVPQIDVSFGLDKNGILQVSATDKGTGKKVKVTVRSNQLSKKTMEKMIEDAETFAVEDSKVKARANAKHDLEHLSYKFLSRINELEELEVDISNEDKRKIKQAALEKIHWIEENENAATKYFRRQKEDLLNTVLPIITKISQNEDVNTESNKTAKHEL